MKVQATEMGFKFGRRIRKGEEFDVPEGETAAWFIPVDHVKEQPKAKPKKADPMTLSEMGKVVPVSPIA